MLTNALAAEKKFAFAATKIRRAFAHAVAKNPVSATRIKAIFCYLRMFREEQDIAQEQKLKTKFLQ